MSDDLIVRPDQASPGQVELVLEQHRRELTAYCYRMLGSAFEAEDAVQETLVRAWRGLDTFEGRASLRTWLYRIATNVCIDMGRRPQRRARPMDLGPAPDSPTHPGPARGEEAWVEPVADGMVVAGDDDPAEVAATRETVRLAFVAALQHLPPRQRAVLVLREVLRWRASEVANLLDTTVASVNSALQRARATLADRAPAETDVADPLDGQQQRLLAQYLDAFEAYDIDRLVQLLHEDAIQTMPPYEMWLQGRDQIARWYLGPGIECRGSRVVPVVASGAPGFAQYRRAEDGGHRAWAIQVLDLADGRVVGVHAFLDVERLFRLFDLPLALP